MYRIEEVWRGDCLDAVVPAAFKNKALRLHASRWEWMTFDIHMAAFALSPKYHADNVFDNRPVMTGLRNIIKFFTSTAREANEAITQFADLKNAQDDVLWPEVVEAPNPNSPTALSSKRWWQLHGARWGLLQKVSMRVFSVGTSSSSSERNFSTFSHVWSNRANKLSFETANKMVFCYFNIRALQKLKDGTGPGTTVASNWLELEMEEQ
jgi:hypothetical protein